MSKRKTLIQKITLFPKGESKKQVKAVWSYIREGMEANCKLSNHLMGQIGSAFYENGCYIDIEKFKAEHSDVFSLDNPVINNIAPPEELNLLPMCIDKVEKDFSELLKNGLALGKTTLRNYKKTAPIPVAKSDIDFDIKFKSHKDGTPNYSSMNVFK